MTELSIQAPGGFVPEMAISFASGDGVKAVDAVNRLPVATRADQATASVAPLAGTATASGVVGPFVPELGRAIWVTLSGTWTGVVTLKRSTDGGATLQPLTFVDGSPRGVWNANVNTPVGEESVAGAAYYLDITPSSGSITYRIEQ